ncbi:hypothetical protein BCY86_06640 [Pajaroellobacter abortibovis]|uniref:Uncharacterized protein n=1 Tax=Pajaroellobacter abortibovis TaxID=1882918 RepID=A0A1L6MXZ7_9BACT|nr:hypothetical protein BCY86_06640 [Pajaroellobacter abortibovis]
MLTLILAPLNQHAQLALETITNSGQYQHQSEFAKCLFSKGKIESQKQRRAEGEVSPNTSKIISSIALTSISLTTSYNAPSSSTPHQPPRRDRLNSI